MMIKIDEFKSVKEFRSAFAGCSIELADGRKKPASRVTKREFLGYQIVVIWNPRSRRWIFADIVGSALKSNQRKMK